MIMNSEKLKSEISASTNVDISAMWAESMEDDDFRFEIKAQRVAVDLARATAELGLSQAQLAEKLNWSPSRVSRVLHGSMNITLRTLQEFATALNLEFDIIYRQACNVRAAQPWEAKVMLDDATSRCKEIMQLHETAQKNLTQSQNILETACTLNRKSWQLAKTATRNTITKIELAA